MEQVKTEGVTQTEGENGHVAEATATGVKVYPTSYLPTKSHMEVSRVPTAMLSGFEIEVTHVVIFLVLTVFLFIGMWKKTGSR